MFTVNSKEVARMKKQVSNDIGLNKISKVGKAKAWKAIKIKKVKKLSWGNDHI